MSKTPPKIHDYQVPLGDSWVDLAGSRTPGRITPLPSITTDEYIRMLKEAQRESNPSSARVSLASNSIRNTPWESPKSPPNSPNTEEEVAYMEAAHRAYVDYYVVDSDWVWDWSGRKDQLALGDIRVVVSHRHPLSLRTAKLGGQGLFSKNVLYSVLLSNVLSLLIGATVGIWLSQRRKAAALTATAARQ